MERFCRPAIEKYASELDVETLPDPVVPLEDQDSVAADKKESVYKPKAGAGKIAAWYNSLGKYQIQSEKKSSFE